MEVYSPKKFQPASFRSNTYVEPQKKRVPEMEEIRNERPIIKKATVVSESGPEWMRRVFYERLKAFFEYEEVS